MRNCFTEVGAHNQSKLKEVSLPLVSLRECKKHWKKHFHDSWICTEGAYLEDACTVSTVIYCEYCDVTNIQIGVC